MQPNLASVRSSPLHHQIELRPVCSQTVLDQSPPYPSFRKVVRISLLRKYTRDNGYLSGTDEQFQQHLNLI